MFAPLPLLRPRHRSSGRGRVTRCTRCDQLFLAFDREPDREWVLLCPRCLVETHRLLGWLVGLLLVALLALLLTGV